MEPSAETGVGPTVPARRRQANRRAARGVAALVLLICAAVLVRAATLRPDPRGYGTHEQVRWGRVASAPCGWLVVYGYPCPTCGMTTAFAHAVRGRWWRALLAQPAGFVLALGTMVATLLSMVVLFTGRWPIGPRVVVSPHWLFLGLLVLLIGSWAFKLAVGLLNHTWPLR